MTAGAKKSEHNPCPICGKSRGKGPNEFAHGKCAEIRAATEGKKIHHSFPRGKTMANITVDSYAKSKTNAAAKKYASGDLPEWMYR